MRDASVTSLAAWWALHEGLGGGGGGFGVEQDGEDFAGDRHVDPFLPSEVVDAASGCHSLGDGGHAGEDVGERLAEAEAFADSAIAAVAADAGGDQVAQAGESEEGLLVGSERDAEASHLGESARHQRGLGVVAVAESIADAGRDGNDILQRSGQFDAEQVAICVDPEAIGREKLLSVCGKGVVVAGDDDAGG